MDDSDDMPQADPAIVEEAGEGDPAAEDVIDGLSEIVARRQAITLLATMIAIPGNVRVWLATSKKNNLAVHNKFVNDSRCGSCMDGARDARGI
jgi:hypothetical protein